MLYIGFVAALPIFLYLWFWKGKDKEAQSGDGDNSIVIRGPKPLPLIGNIHNLDKEHVQRTFYDWMKQYGPVYRFFLFGEEFVIISDPEIMRDVFSVLNNRPHHVLPSDLNYNNSGVTLSNFEGNQKRVKEITWKIYHETFQDPYIEKLEDEILEEFITDLVTQQDGILDVDKAVMRLTAAQFSAEITGQKPSEEAVNASLALFNSVVDLFSKLRPLILKKFSWARNFPGPLKRVVNTYITSTSRIVNVMSEEARKTYKKGEEHGMLQKFYSIQEEENTKAGHEVITDGNVFVSAIIDVIAGGFRGTCSAISVCFMYLLLYPEVRKKVNEEMSEIRLRKKIKDVVPPDVPYLYACIIECVRISSNIFVTLPHHVDEDKKISGYRFMKNQTVLGSVWNVHHSEEIWGDPFNLRPERFLDPSGKLVPTSHPLRQAFIPFGVGMRYCKGNHTAMDKVFKCVSRILYRCDIQTVSGQPMPSGDSLDFKSVVGLPVPKFACKFIERK